MLSNGNKAIPRWCGCKKQEYFEKNKDKINEYRRRKYAENKEAKNISLRELSLILIIIMPLSFSAGAPPSSWAPPLLQDGFGGSNLVHDTPTTMPCPCSEKSPSPREERGHWRRRRSAVGNTWAGWGSIPVFFPPGMAGHSCLILRSTSLSLQGDPANIGKGRSRPARMPQEQTESGGIVLAAYAGPRAPRGGVTQKRRCTHRHSQSSIDCQ